jgi:glycosyltransferase involved in cell wall biosynthesis
MEKEVNADIYLPKISVLLPNLNNYSFLKERIQTILDQTLTDWELIIVDSYSEDGAWELFQDFAKKDSRIRISQAPREGMYAGLNNCIHLARGEYIYIATSDDTMTPDCLEKMAAALDEHPECDLAHCCLTLIDRNGKEIEDKWSNWDKVKFFGDRIHQKHIRFAPYDGILYCVLGTIYTSLTELLIRQQVFKKIGLFKSEFGSSGDFEWGLRASLVCNTIHIPEYLATWRVYPEQLTQNTRIFSEKGQQLWCDAIASALSSLKKDRFEIAEQLSLRDLTFYYRFLQLKLGIKACRFPWQKVYFLTRFSISRSDVTLRYLKLQIKGKSFSKFYFLKSFLKRLGYENNIQNC